METQAGASVWRLRLFCGDPPRVRIISDNTFYAPYEGTADEVNIIGRIRWFAREI